MHIFPYLSLLREGPQWEKFCRVKVLLYVRHQDLKELTENGTIAWLTLYNNHIEEINANLIDLLESHIDDEEREINDKDKLFEEDDDE